MRELDSLLKSGIDTASARRGKTMMGPYTIPEISEDVWVEKHVPVTDERVLFLGGEVDDAMIYRIIAQMMYLDVLSHEDIYLYVNSPGGSVIAGLALYDAIQHVKSNIITVNLGMAASTASLVLGAGVRGKRVGVSSSGVMVHQPSSGGLVGNAATIDKRVDADQIARIKDVVITIYSDMTGRSREQITEDISYDNYMTAKEALEFGLIDEIIENDPAWDLDP
jgi:ATP-dependent Clp endopeptidase proteolytic subunit ClpP